MTTDYTRTLNIDEPLAYSRSNGTIRYYVADALGSITALTDANGIVTTSYKYDEFGKVTITGSDYNAFQYTGRENDGTGLYYYRARYYSPEMRRFISEDPIRFWGGDINFYAYVWNSPVNWTDPHGLLGWDTVARWIAKKVANQIGKRMGKKMTEFDNDIPEERDDDGDGTPNFQDPDSEYCRVNCNKPMEPVKCH